MRIIYVKFFKSQLLMQNQKTDKKRAIADPLYDVAERCV